MNDHQQQEPEGAQSAGLLTGLTDVAKNALGLLFSRVELAALEMSEVRTVLLKLVLAFGFGIVATWFAVAYWTALVVVLSWDSLGWKILLIIALLFTLIATGILLYIRSMLRQDKLSLHSTMAELRQDRDALL
jgi:uncharacterized membrane protein YqjE